MPPQFYINLTFAPPESRRTTPGVFAFSSTTDVRAGDVNPLSDVTSEISYGLYDDTFSNLDFGSGMDQFSAFNDSLYTLNGTYGNGTNFINGWGGSMYPSGYSVYEIAAIALFISFAMIVVVVGNMLVIIAIATENSLKHITNWFIASLAVADLLLGLVIMPFSLANLLMGYWVFGELWCELHSAIDVLLSTASINNICLISLDRYWSITHALDYLKDRTPKKAAFMIVSVWVISGLISIPPLLGWKVDRVSEEFPKCTVSDKLGYVLYSAMGSFYVPSCIMIFVYIRIYYAAKARANRGVPKDRIKKKTESKGCCGRRKKSKDKHKGKKKNEDGTYTTTFSTHPEIGNNPSDSSKHSEKNALIRNKDVQVKVQYNDDSINDPSPGSPKQLRESDEENFSIPKQPLRTLSEQVQADHQNHNMKGENGIYLRPNQGNRGESSLVLPPSPNYRDAASGSGTSSASPTATLRRGGSSQSVEGEQTSDMERSSSDSGALTRCSVIKPLKMRFCQPLMGKRLTKPKRELIDMGRVSSPCVLDNEREKKRIARKKEKRATLILGMIMGSFIACWLPFFFMYILVPLCPICYIPGYAFDLAFWLGYMNSAFNPVIYTIFNQDFRKAFRKILFK